MESTDKHLAALLFKIKQDKKISSERWRLPVVHWELLEANGWIEQEKLEHSCSGYMSHIPFLITESGEEVLRRFGYEPYQPIYSDFIRDGYKKDND